MKIQSGNELKEMPLQIHPYRTFFKRLKGLMFRRQPITDEGILLEPCNSIHMFFMFFPIDVVFLNKEYRIISLKENVQPWTVVPPLDQARSALELPAGTISKYKLKMEDQIIL